MYYAGVKLHLHLFKFWTALINATPASVMGADVTKKVRKYEYLYNRYIYWVQEIATNKKRQDNYPCMYKPYLNYSFLLLQ